jgi:hypothetical protein
MTLCSRRHFLEVGAAGLLGLTLADVLRQEARSSPSKARPPAQGVILIWLGGGPATIDLWDLKPDAPDTIRGEFRPIKTKADGVAICEHLPRTAEVMDRCVLVRSLQHGITAHGPGTLFMTTGHAPTAALEHPSLGSLAARLLPPSSVPPYVVFAEARGSGFSGGPGFLGPAYGPFEVEAASRDGRMKVEGVSLPDDFSIDSLDDRTRLRDVFDRRFKALDEADVPASLDRFQQRALDMLRSDQTRKAFDLSQEKDTLRDGYGRTAFGQSVLAARRLIEAGARFVTVDLGGWDTHAGNFRTLQNQLLPQLDRALASLVSDLDAHGLLETTVIYCAGEFGRTPRINGTAGRDHWARSMAVLLAGGGLKKGLAYGSTDEHGMTPVTEPCSPGDLSATIFHRLGLEPTSEVRTSTGRPLAIFREGKVLEAIIN